MPEYGSCENFHAMQAAIGPTAAQLAEHERDMERIRAATETAHGFLK
jgi:hypothetical protein